MMGFAAFFIYFLFIFLDRKFQHFGCIPETGFQFFQGRYNLLQARPLTSQLLGFMGVIPDIGIFEFPADFLESVTLFSVVKDTP